MTQPKLADDYASINAALNRLEFEKQAVREIPVVQPMYGGLDPALATGLSELDLIGYEAAEWDPA